MHKPTLLITVLLATLAGTVFAKHESVDELKAKAASAEGSKQVELFSKIAERQLDALAKAYDANDKDQARLALQDVLDYSLKAAETARTKGDRMKKTEISIRKIARRLEEIRRSLPVDDRPPVGQAIDKLEDARTVLLRAMFKK